MTDMSVPPAEAAAGGDSRDLRIERLDQLYFGKYRGTVVDNADPEQLGRLRLMVPSLFGGSANPQPTDPFVTDWAWPCVPFGGTAEQGFFFVPEVGAKVWV
ncbi:MAG: phage baseplate assembly protein V, partial [Betaproteobacteria bacterium]